MSIISKLIDIIYPPACPICGCLLHGEQQEHMPEGICDACGKGIKKIEPPTCTTCGIPFISKSQDSHICGDCILDKPDFDAAFSLYVYEGSIIEAVHGLKYKFKTRISRVFGPVMAGHSLMSSIRKTGSLLVMPIPLHKSRLRERGFNQSLALARHISRNLECELDFLSLMRIKYTVSQTGLTVKERKKNVSGAFNVKYPAKVAGRNILLVDDVMTTGNTLNECAKTLKKAGCMNVYCVTLARAL